MASININDVSPYVQYVASGSETVFAYNFPIYDEDDLKVYYTLSGASGDDSADILTISTDYTVSGVGSASGGNVTLTSGSFPSGAAAASKITIARFTSQSRTTQFTTSGQITADGLNQQLNEQIMMAQDDRRDIQNRGVRYQNSQVITDKDRTLPRLGANQIWVMNATNTAIEAVDISTLLALL